MEFFQLNTLPLSPNTPVLELGRMLGNCTKTSWLPEVLLELGLWKSQRILVNAYQRKKAIGKQRKMLYVTSSMVLFFCSKCEAVKGCFLGHKIELYNSFVLLRNKHHHNRITFFWNRNYEYH